MGILGLLATTTAGSIVNAVTTGIFLGSSLYVTSRARKKPTKVPKLK